MENKTILITGAAGYIGGTFAYEALKRGYKVIGLDNFSNSNKKNIIQKKGKVKVASWGTPLLVGLGWPTLKLPMATNRVLGLETWNV